MMVAAVSLPGAAASTTDPQTPKITTAENDHVGRPPLLPSEKDNNNNNKISDTKKKPKSRIVSSRYMSPSTSTSTSNSSTISSSSSSFSSRRFPSPLVSRNSTPLSNAPSPAPPKRSISADRRRPSAARPLTPDLEVSAATKLLVTSTRSLSVSFQGEAFSLPISKTKVAPSSPNLTSTRKATPERRRTSTTPLRGGGDQAAAEHSKLSDQHRWPARNRSTNPLSMSMDFSTVNGERSKLISSMSVVRALQQSIMIDERRPSLDGRSSLDLGGGNSQRASDGSSVNNEASDSDSVSSGSTSGVQECSGVSNGSRRGIVGSARFWQETNSRMRRLQDPGSPLSTSPGSKLMLPSKSKRYTSNNNGLSSSPIRPLSPSKGMTAMGSCSSSPLRGHSPSRIRNAAVSTINNNFNDTPSVLSYAVDVRRGKVGENKIIDAHLLRLLYNRNLQWRFVNARTEAVLLVQKRSAEKNLWNAWITISDLRDAVTKKRHRLQLLRQKLKLSSILKRQMNFLEDWASFDKDHSVSLLGATESLRASTLRLPVIGGAIADVQSLQDAIVSAVDIMQAMTSSIYLLLPTVEDVNSLVSELAKVTTKERALLEQCTDLISLLAAMQVKDSSLRTHILQHNRV
ncbi:hypothetical protein ABFS83_02G042600 [Erythranthe nasuta]